MNPGRHLVGAQKSAKLESFGFRAADMSPDENAQAWTQAVAALFDVDELGAGDDAPFRADLESYALGPVLIGRTRFSSQRFVRSLDVIARSGVDHVILQLYVSGGFSGVAGRLPVIVKPGDICLFDLSQTLETRAVPSESITLVSPRRFLESRFPRADLFHGLVLPADNVLARLLGRHLGALLELASHMTLDESEAAAEGTMALAAACLQGEMERRDALHGGTEMVLLLKLRRFIDKNLGLVDLNAETIAAEFGMSRAKLYRLFAPVGGIADYIRVRRLHRAFFDLALPQARVSEVARRWGFSSEAVFARAFKTAYGISPSGARGLSHFVKTAPEQKAGSEAVIARWMKEIAVPASSAR